MHRSRVAAAQGLGVVPPLPRRTAPVAEARPARPVLYGSFSCPWCYLASQHTDRLPDPLGRPRWRMVDPDPHLPVTGLRLDSAGRSRLQHELDAVRPVALPGEQLPAQAPAFLPHTGPAVVGYAEACGAGVGDLVRRVLFDAYWQHGADSGSPEVLRRLLVEPLLAGHSDSWPLRESGYAVTLAGGPITTTAYCRVRDWRADWQHTAGSAVPALIGEGSSLTGPDVVATLRARVLDEHASAPGPLTAPGPPAWIGAGDRGARFLSLQGPAFEGTGGLSAYGSIRPTVSEPGKPDGEVAT